MDILLIHAGEPPAEGGRIILSPLGTLFLAEYLNQNRINAKIVNTCLIKGDPFQAICSWIKRHKIKIVSLPLHWHQQSSKVISLVTKLKREFPGIKTIIGGSTATFFHREIVNQFSVVDFIIRGDAEIPLLNLIRRIIEGGKDFYRIPNLTWRKKNLIVVNKHIYVCSSAILKSVSHPRNDLFLNNNGFFAENEQYLKKPGMKSAFFNIARGCTGNCPFCGGGKQAQQILYKRK